MITVRTMWQTGVIVSLTLFVTGQARSQFPWQTPVKRDPAEIAASWGRVFVSTVGHNYFTFNDPYFRIILLRAMAWTMHESFDPFKPLVTAHLER